MESFLQGTWQMAFAILFICLAFPFFVIPIIIISTMYYLFNRSFRCGVRDLRRLENTTRSPIFSNISSTLSGLDVIHAFGKEKAFLRKFNSSFDINATCLFLCSMSNRWLALRIDALSVLVTLVTSISVVIMHGHVSPALIGLAVSSATTMSGIMQLTVRLITDCELRFLSFERINSFSHSLEPEGGHGPKGIPPNNWPNSGSLTFRNVKLCYRPGLPFALNDVSFHIRPGEKIGVVGRTGAGKSSLLTALFRIVDLSEGTIIIDNLDVSTLDVISLRSRLSLIPQDPVFFSGTVRSNLDPAKCHKDKDIWNALLKTNLKGRIEKTQGKLDEKINSTAENFSVGERQLLCLARALLKRSRILVLDEATSGLDITTESVIQETVLKEFSQSTLIIIAHRLETVTKCDRVMVIENGKMVEFDEPGILLQNPGSLFHKMMTVKVRGDH